MATLKIKVNGVWEDIPAIQGVDGKSAYQSALDGGYVGTEVEFNADLSLVSEKMNLDGSNSLVEDLTFVGNGVLSYDADRQILQYTNPDGTTNDVGAELWFSEGKASGAIANGAPVQFAGVQGDHYLFKTAVPSEINANPSLFMGIATSDIANNAWGKVTHFGVVHDINTNGWSAGTILWFDSVNGGLTSTKPSYPNAQIQVCAVVVQNSTVGSIIVRPTIYQDAYTRSETDTKLDTKVPLLTTTETITVGTGGQYATINQALAYATKKYPTYVSASNRPRITISLLSGFVMAEQVIVDGIDLSWITISSVNAEVSITRSALTISVVGYYPAFIAHNGAFLPIIDTLFNMDTSGTATDRNGIMALNNSKAIINSGKGVKNAGTHGIMAEQGSTINAQGANASGAGGNGIYAFRGSTINAVTANASGAGTYGIYAYQGSTINAYVANASGAGNIGIYAEQSSTINAEYANASGAVGTGIFANRGSTINALETNASGAGNIGIYAFRGSTINAFGANARKGASDSTNDFSVYDGSFITKKAGTGGVSQTINTLTSNGVIFG